MARNRGPRVIPIEITTLDAHGMGVGQFDGREVRVKGVTPVAQVQARIIKRRRGVWLGVPEGDVRSVCSAYPACGGCAMQHLPGHTQLNLKSDALCAQLAAVGVTPPRLETPVEGPMFGYRRRARLGVRHLHASGETLMGFREAFGSRVARTMDCPVLVEPLQRVFAALREALGQMRGRAAIPQIELAAGDGEAAFIVRHLEPLVSADIDILRRVEQLSGATALTQHGGYDTVCTTANEPAPLLRYTLERFGLCLHFAPIDFIQVNGIVNAKLVSEAACELVNGGSTRILDLFCGIGNFSLVCARAGANVVGVEADEGLVRRAAANAALNGMSARTEFIAANLYADMQAPVVDALAWCEQVLIDPPRSGAGPVLPGVGASRARRIVYVSCHPDSFVVDAATLAAFGFTLTKLRLFDMFPHTAHVEIFGVFDRR